MKDWPLIHRTDDSIVVEQDRASTRTLDSPFAPDRVLRNLVRSDRVCGHGVTHPDPDSLAWLHTQVASYAWEDHACDGCCNFDEGEGSVV